LAGLKKYLLDSNKDIAMKHHAEKLQYILKLAPVIPVITINKGSNAIPLAEALLEGGLKTLEITMRTPEALAAIESIASAFPEAEVGAGTVLNVADYQLATQAGARFIVSPGATDSLIAHAQISSIPFLPGVNTPSEVMRLLQVGITTMKFFPAEPAGGVPMLKAMSAPLAQALFCPTGGITLGLAPDYLALPNVICVGGSWMLQEADLKSGNWSAIKKLAAAAANL
jgi:2-dehydro-3-deoxyphosphogluconate aldolase/(4S)-4-hydroxy-2-oxoglutarate aldolase